MRVLPGRQKAALHYVLKWQTATDLCLSSSPYRGIHPTHLGSSFMSQLPRRGSRFEYQLSEHVEFAIISEHSRWCAKILVCGDPVGSPVCGIGVDL